MNQIFTITKICLLTLLIFNQQLLAQTIGTFNSVTPGTQSQNLVIPSTHSFQRIIKSGDALTAGGTLGSSLDFTGYVPISGSSLDGYLSISSESTPAAVGIMRVTYNFVTNVWDKSNSGNVTFPTSAFGTTPVTRFCSGTVTPNGTIMVSEENVGLGDTNGDGYNDDGWIIEIDPATRTVIESDATHTGVDKLWAIGRQARENVMIMPDNRTLYTGADNGTNSFVYKFVATTAGNFSSGQLYVLVTTAALGTGTWTLLANTTQANRNSTVSLSTSAGAYSFNGVEDVERGPDGKIYFTAKGPGRIYRFTDNGTTVSNLAVFVENTTYDVDPGVGVANEAWGIGNDNLAFDGEGNLWVLQDGGRNHIWVVGPTHTAGTPAVRLFGKTPAGSEPTGITFTPDYKFMFISFQHPNVGNSTSQLDAAGISVVFNTHTTVVIGRTENLGPTATLPLNFTEFKLTEENNIPRLSWSVSNVVNHARFEIERSADGRNFEKIYEENKILSDGSSHSLVYNDRQVPVTGTLIYYRIKEVGINGDFHYSEIRSIRLNTKDYDIVVYPNPANEILNIDYPSTQTNVVTIGIVDAMGRLVLTEQKTIPPGKNILQAEIHKLAKGNYTLFINSNSSNE
jgi:secreted PhoX family phosphatase